MKMMKNTMMKVVVSAAVAAVVLMSGCAATPPGASAVAVPTDRVMAYQAKPEGTDFGTVIITRDSSFFGAGLAMTVSIDAKPVAEVKSGERVKLYVPSGDHIFSAQLGVNPRKDVEVIVKPGVTRYYRITMHSSGVTDLDPTIPDQ
jgi:hypothetical protein